MGVIYFKNRNGDERAPKPVGRFAIISADQ